MEENGKKNVVNHFEAGSNCQVFNGNISGCVFAMPGSSVTQQGVAPTAVQRDGRAAAEQRPQPDVATRVACVARVRAYFWRDSAMAVIFCKYCELGDMEPICTTMGIHHCYITSHYRIETHLSH